MKLPEILEERSLTDRLYITGEQNRENPVNRAIISPYSLANFCKKEGFPLNLSLEPPPDRSSYSPPSFSERFSYYAYPKYGAVFSRLKHQLPPEQQKKLLVKFFTELDFGGNYLPVSNRQHLGELFARVNNIPWFKPREEPDCSRLQELVNETNVRLNRGFSLPVRIIREWSEVEGEEPRMELWSAARLAAIEAKRVGMMDTVAIMAGNLGEWIARNGMYDLGVTRSNNKFILDLAMSTIGHILVLNTSWICVEDLMPEKGYSKENPFEPDLAICELGCCPIGNIKGELMIFVPPVQKAA